MNLIKQAAVIFGCLALGELIVFITGVKLPSSIIGLGALWFFLQIGWVKVKDISDFSDFLIKNMGIFFVPPCVAMLNYFGVIKASFWPIMITTLASTILVIFATGLTHQYLRRKK